MKKSIITLVVLAIITFSSCKPILYTVYGIKKPDYMPVQKVQQQAWKLGIDTSGMRYIYPEQYTVAINRIKTLPNAYIFNAKGQMIVWQTGDVDCKGTLAEFLQGLKPDMQLETDSLSLESVFSELEVVRVTSAQTLAPTQTPDYRVVMYWGTFLGKLNRDYIPEWINACRNNQHCRIEPVLVNCDLLKPWKPRYDMKN